MLSNLSLGRYILGDSLVHKLNPIFKILSLLIMTISIFFVDSYIDLIMLSLYLLLVISYSNIEFRIYIENIKGIYLFLIMILMVDLIFFTDINTIIFDLFKFIFIIMYISILTYTTAMTEINYGTFKILMPLNKFISANDVAMVVTIILRFIPNILISMNKITECEKLRGINLDSKKLKDKIINAREIIIPAVNLSFQKSLLLADTMDMRLYNYGKSRTNYRLNKWKKRDSFLLVLNLLILLIVIFY